MRRLIIATHNRHKTEEFRTILQDLIPEICDLTEFPDIPIPEENGDSFLENASIKALHAARLLPGQVVLADDSGLEVDALGGAPGIFSARYAGPEASDADNREKLLRSMDGKTNRAASFCCVLALAEGDHIRSHFEGRSFGNILPEMRGDGGFGYDPLFVPSGHTQTFAELASAVKHQISHRGKAIEAFCETLHLT